MATSRLVAPGVWVRIGPYWLRIKDDPLNAGIVVPVHAHPGPLWIDVNSTIPGFRLQWGPPEGDIGDPPLVRPYAAELQTGCGSCGAPSGTHTDMCDRLRVIDRDQYRRALEVGVA